MGIDPFKDDCVFAEALLYCGSKPIAVDSSTGLIIYYRTGNIEAKDEFIESRQSDILGFFGYDFGQKKYQFTLCKDAHARIVPMHKKQVVVNEGVLVDIGETVRVQNSECSIDLLLASRH